jgi:hypothetical protein
MPAMSHDIPHLERDLDAGGACPGSQRQAVSAPWTAAGKVCSPLGRRAISQPGCACPALELFPLSPPTSNGLTASGDVRARAGPASGFVTPLG